LSVIRIAPSLTFRVIEVDIACGGGSKAVNTPNDGLGLAGGDLDYCFYLVTRLLAYECCKTVGFCVLSDSPPTLSSVD